MLRRRPQHDDIYRDAEEEEEDDRWRPPPRGGASPRGAPLTSREYLTVGVPASSHVFTAETWWIVDRHYRPVLRQGATPLLVRGMREYGWSEAYARRVLAAYRQWMELHAVAATRDVVPCYKPSRDVKRLWKQHILDPVNYVRDCALLCDYVVEHNPDDAEQDERTQRQRQRATREALDDRYRDVDVEVWRELYEDAREVSPARASRTRNVPWDYSAPEPRREEVVALEETEEMRPQQRGANRLSPLRRRSTPTRRAEETEEKCLKQRGASRLSPLRRRSSPTRRASPTRRPFLSPVVTPVEDLQIYLRNAAALQKKKNHPTRDDVYYSRTLRNRLVAPEQSKEPEPKPRLRQAPAAQYASVQSSRPAARQEIIRRNGPKGNGALGFRQISSSPALAIGGNGRESRVDEATPRHETTGERYEYEFETDFGVQSGSFEMRPQDDREFEKEEIDKMDPIVARRHMFDQNHTQFESPVRFNRTASATNQSSPYETTKVQIKKYALASSQPAGRNQTEDRKSVTIHIRDQLGGITSSRAHQSTKLGRIFTAFATGKGLQPASLYYFLNGKVVDASATPGSLGLRDNDKIDCVIGYGFHQ